MNVAEHLAIPAKLYPDRAAVRFEGHSLSYEQLDRLSAAAAMMLRDAGIHRGDRVAILLPNVPAFFVWYFAIQRIAAITVSISPRSAPSEVGFILSDSESKAVISDDRLMAACESEFPACLSARFVAADSGMECNQQPLSAQQNADLSLVDAEPHDAAALLYTSGTTGFPKGATLSQRNIRSNVCAFNHLCGMKPHDRLLLAVPLFHCFGQNALMNSGLNAGATMVLQRNFDLTETKRLITSESVTQIYGVPMMFQLLLDSCQDGELGAVEYCFSAAATLPVQLAQQWKTRFGMPIHEGYGLTETSPFASYNHRLEFVDGSIGSPIDCVEMRIVDSETGEPCGPGVLGEIVIRGPNVMLGYWNRPDETQAAIQDGWFHSGDIGRRDERGYFFIVDRVKDMITVGGLKVFPAEVERVLLDHPAVAQVAVAGLADEVFGEKVVAFIVPAADHTLDPTTQAQIHSHARQHLATYKVPAQLVELAELPRNPSGKVLKRTLREFQLEASENPTTTAANPQAAAADESQPPSLAQQIAGTHPANARHVATAFVQHMVQSLAELEELPAPDTRFLDAGLDSLLIVEMSKRIQDELGEAVDIPATLVFDHPRISDLSSYLLGILTDTDSPADEAARSTERPAHVTDPQAAQRDLEQEISGLSEEQALSELMKELDGP